MSRTVVQIMAPCRVNKGDQLMVEALYRKLGKRYYLPIPVWNNVPASRFWSAPNLIKMAYQGIQRSIQVRTHGKPAVILDGSGYQLGDPWARMSKALSVRLLLYQYYRAKGVRIIMLPQSIGPFNNRLVASNAAGILQLADLVFVRCESSRRYALEIGCPDSKIRIAPDYSNIVPPKMPKHPEHWSRCVCVVPSMRMIDKTSTGVSNVYLSALIKYIHGVWDRGLEPFLLVHQEEDMTLARTLKKTLDRPIMIIDPPPRVAKGILASSRAVIASRYHAVVSSLSQGTPVIGTGWTHKYQALFRDYTCEECLIERLDSTPHLEESLDRVLDEESRSTIVEKLRVRAQANRERTLRMFSELERVIDTPDNRR